MAFSGFEQVVQPPPLVPRDQATLLTSAPQISDPDFDIKRIGNGVTFRSHGTNDLLREQLNICGAADAANNYPASTAAIRRFSGFNIFADEFCSVLAVDEDDLRSWASTRLNAFESAQVAAEAMTGAATGNDSLRYVNGAAVPILNAGAATAVRYATALIEDELGRRLHGAVGMIHVTPGTLFAMNAGGGLDEEEGDEIPTRMRAEQDVRHRLGDNADPAEVARLVAEELASNPPQYDRWTTPSGHIIVADAGYDGHGPTGTAAAAGQAYAYASGIVEYALGPVTEVGRGNQILNLVHDDRTEILNRGAVVRFDPETCFGILIDLTAP